MCLRSQEKPVKDLAANPSSVYKCFDHGRPFLLLHGDADGGCVRNGAGLRNDIDCGNAPIYLRAAGVSTATADGKPEHKNRDDCDGELWTAKAWQTPPAPHREAKQRHGLDHG
jgi:hypothetical protein